MNKKESCGVSECCHHSLYKSTRQAGQALDNPASKCWLLASELKDLVHLYVLSADMFGMRQNNCLLWFIVQNS